MTSKQMLADISYLVLLEIDTFETLEEAKAKVEELRKEHINGDGSQDIWFEFSIEESYEKLVPRTFWNVLYRGNKKEDFE